MPISSHCIGWFRGNQSLSLRRWAVWIHATRPKVVPLRNVKSGHGIPHPAWFERAFCWTRLGKLPAVVRASWTGMGDGGMGRVRCASCGTKQQHQQATWATSNCCCGYWLLMLVPVLQLMQKAKSKSQWITVIEHVIEWWTSFCVICVYHSKSTRSTWDNFLCPGKQLTEALSIFQRFTSNGGRATRHIFSTLLKLGGIGDRESQRSPSGERVHHHEHLATMIVKHY